jgi:hypothetical protein
MALLSSLQRRRRERGNTLLLVMIIIVVLTIVGIAALRMAQQDSVTVSQRIYAQRLRACANAATNFLWAEYANFGITGDVVPKPIEGTDYTMAGAHYDVDETVIATVKLADAIYPTAKTAVGGGIQDMDITNTFRSANLGGQPHTVLAHCADRDNNQYEVELLVKFGL